MPSFQSFLAIMVEWWFLNFRQDQKETDRNRHDYIRYRKLLHHKEIYISDRKSISKEKPH